MNGPTPEMQMEHLLRELAPQALGVVARRFRDFSWPKTLCKKHCWPPSGNGRRRAFPRIRAGG